MSWGRSLSEQARRDVDVLVDAGLRAAGRALDASRWLRPIPLIANFTGTVAELDFDAAALPRRTPAALTSGAVYLLAQHATEARAVALVTGSRLTAERIEVAEVWVEHRDGEALTVLCPIDRARGRQRLGAPRAYTGSRIIWTATHAA